MKTEVLTILTAAATAITIASPSIAETELVYGSWMGTKNATNVDAIEPYFKMIDDATGGEIKWKMIAGGQLANGPGTPESVGSNLMDAGLVMAPYQPSMLPTTNMIFSQSLTGDDYLASVGAMNELVMLHCPSCREEYEENNAVAFAGYGTTPYLFMCRGDIKSAEDMRDKRVRASGGGVSIVEILGAVPIAMPPSEATSALERGTIDCVLGSVAWMSSYGYIDVTDSVIQSPMGMGGPPMLMYVNRDVWYDLTAEQRRIHIDLAPDLVAMAVFDAQLAVDKATLEQARAAGIKFHDGGEPFAAVMAKRDSLQYELNASHATDAGVENAKAVLDAYLAAYERWKGLVDESTSKEAFRDILWDEVYSKVDPENL